MSILAEDIPEHDWARFAFEIGNSKLLCASDNFGVVAAGLTHASEVALHIRHEDWHTARAEILRERLQRHRLARSGRARDQTVAIRHLWQQLDRVLARFGDDDGFAHDTIVE